MDAQYNKSYSDLLIKLKKLRKKMNDIYKYHSTLWNNRVPMTDEIWNKALTQEKHLGEYEMLDKIIGMMNKLADEYKPYPVPGGWSPDQLPYEEQ